MGQRPLCETLVVVPIILLAIEALNAEQTMTRDNGINMDPLTPGCTNLEQGSIETPEGFTMVKYRKSRRKISPKNNKDSSSRKESLGPEQISGARKKRGRPCSSIAFDASNITNKEEWPKCFEGFKSQLDPSIKVSHAENNLLEY